MCWTSRGGGRWRRDEWSVLQATDLLKAGKREHPLALWPSTSLTNGVYRPSTFPCDGQHLEQLQLLKDLQLDGQDLRLRICSLPRAHHYTRRSSGLKSRQDTTPDSSQNLQIPKTTHANTQYLQDGTQAKTGLRVFKTLHRYRQAYRKRTLARWSRARLLWIPRFETEAPNIDQAILAGTHGMALAPKRCPDTDHVCGLNTRKPINLIEATELRPR